MNIACYERGLFQMVCYEWSVTNKCVLKRNLWLTPMIWTLCRNQTNKYFKYSRICRIHHRLIRPVRYFFVGPGRIPIFCTHFYSSICSICHLFLSTVTYKQHVEGLCQKILARNNILRCLALSSWGASTPTIRTSALAIVFSAAEYAAPVWCCSCHGKKLDVALNDAQRLIARCLRPTPTGLLPILAGIASPNLHREQLTYRLGCQAAFNNQHPLYGSIPDLQSFQPQRLKSRRPFHRHAATLIGSEFEIKRAWMNSWNDITPPSQRRINNSSKCSNCYGPRTFGGGSLC